MRKYVIFSIRPATLLPQGIPRPTRAVSGFWAGATQNLPPLSPEDGLQCDNELTIQHGGWVGHSGTSLGTSVLSHYLFLPILNRKECSWRRSESCIFPLLHLMPGGSWAHRLPSHKRLFSWPFPCKFCGNLLTQSSLFAAFSWQPQPPRPRKNICKSIATVVASRPSPEIASWRWFCATQWCNVLLFPLCLPCLRHETLVCCALFLCKLLLAASHLGSNTGSQPCSFNHCAFCKNKSAENDLFMTVAAYLVSLLQRGK